MSLEPPQQVGTLQTALHAKAKGSPGYRFYALYDKVYHRWRKQYGGMKAEEAKRLKELEEENRRLKEIVAEKELDIQMLKHLTEGNW